MGKWGTSKESSLIFWANHACLPYTTFSYFLRFGIFIFIYSFLRFFLVCITWLVMETGFLRFPLYQLFETIFISQSKWSKDTKSIPKPSLIILFMMPHHSSCAKIWGRDRLGFYESKVLILLLNRRELYFSESGKHFRKRIERTRMTLKSSSFKRGRHLYEKIKVGVRDRFQRVKD